MESNVIADLQAESKSHADVKKTLKVRFFKEQEKVIALENYFWPENLRFMNVPEQEGENCANI